MNKKIKRIQCSHCGAAPYLLREFWKNHCIDFDAISGQRAGEGFMSEGDPSHVQAYCACGHDWRLRGISQIIQLDID